MNRARTAFNETDEFGTLKPSVGLPKDEREHARLDRREERRGEPR